MHIRNFGCGDQNVMCSMTVLSAFILKLTSIESDTMSNIDELIINIYELSCIDTDLH
jgi:hypothetical protein